MIPAPIPVRHPPGSARGPLRGFVALAASLCLGALVGCSGGGDGGGANAPGTSAGNGVVTDPVLLPRGDQPNTESTSLAEGVDGALHVAYADIEGRLFYARCDGDCGVSGNWRGTVVSASDTDFTVPKLLLAPGDMPILAAHRADVFNPGITSIAACTGDCLAADGWLSTDVRAHGVPHLQARLEDEDWFALDAAGRPRMAFIEKDGLVSFDDARLRLIGCDENCSDAASWRERDVVATDLQSATPASLAVGADGGVRLTVPLEPIGGDVSRLAYLECTAGSCLDAGAPWSDPLILAERAGTAFEQNETALALGPDGRPSVALFDDVDPARLSVQRCVGDCTSPAGWTVLEVPPAAPSGTLRGAGAGVDARFDGATLELGFISSRRASPLPDTLTVARCNAACLDGAGTWSATEIASTADLVLEPEPICTFAGTATRGPVSLVGSGTSYTVSPQWTCGTAPIEVTDADGNVFIDNAADLRFLEIAAFAGRSE